MLTRFPIALICLSLLFLAGTARAESSTPSPCEEWNSLQQAVRDGTMGREDARGEIIRLDARLREAYAGKSVRSPFHFPVKGYGPDSIGGERGSGFRPAGYNFYDGNRHGGHPAHDLFIRDNSGDGLDDVTGGPVEVVSMSDGVVIGVNPSWEHPSAIRGGIYLWVYDPADGLYYYYAHLALVFVAPGDRLKAGDTIALLGRTGKNAWPRRSPTHLHFMCLAFDKGRMTPRDSYRHLLEAVAGPGKKGDGAPVRNTFHGRNTQVIAGKGESGAGD